MKKQFKNAIFLDRDGTIIEDKGYLKRPEDVVFFPNSFEALRMLGDFFELLIVTHQNGVAEGVLSLEEVEDVNEHIARVLESHGVEILRIYTCPHRSSDSCMCHKPKIYFMNEAARDYSLDLSRSYVIGDHPHDIEFAKNAGATGVYVLTGHGRKHYHELPEGAAAVCDDVMAATRWILEKEGLAAKKS
jgi:D-glycero-D-manno-heptose 1,7-bisphosphate phosphatase